MRVHDGALVFGMELRGHEIGVLGDFDNLDKSCFGVEACGNHACLAELVDILVVELVAMAVTLGNHLGAINLVGLAAFLQAAGIGAEAHGATHIGDVFLLFHHIDDGVSGGRGNLDGMGIGIAKHIACELDHGALHAKADAEKRYLVFASIAHGHNLTLDATSAEAGSHENTRKALQTLVNVLLGEVFGIDIAHLDLAAQLGASMDEGLADGLVGVGQLDIFAYETDVDFLLGVVETIEEGLPLGEVYLVLERDVEFVEHLHIEFLVAHLDGDLVDAADIAVFNDTVACDIAEKTDFVADTACEGLLGAADDNVGLNTLLLQSLDAVLRGLGLEFASGGEIRNIGEVYDDAVVAKSPFELAHSLDKGIGLDVAHGAANLGDDKLVIARIAKSRNAVFNLIGDMRNDLHGLAKEIATALFLDDVLIDTARRYVIGLRCGHTGEALVMTEVEVGLGTILGNIALAMLVGVERAGVDIDIRVKFLVGDRIATSLEQTCQRGGNNALAKR